MENDLKADIGNAAFAFRGYNVTNLGRSHELLCHRAYGPTVQRFLREAGQIASDVLKKRVRLVDRVEQQRETTLRTYGEAVAIVVAMELAQLRLLEDFHGIQFAESKLAFGYSLGEVAALAAAGVFEMDQALLVPLAMSPDSAELAKDVNMGVLFSRGPALAEEDVTRLCLRLNAEGRGVIGVSSILSPNTMLLLGQGRTMQRFKKTMHDLLPDAVHMRISSEHWPPLHTPIVWQRNIPDRSAEMMHTLVGGFTAPRPQVVSLVTGKASYNDYNTRLILHEWVDHPQRLWDGVYETLAAGVETVIHVGATPNLIPATFKRLSDNVTEQVSGRSLGSLGLRAVSHIAGRQWLKTLLPSRTALLRASNLRHVILEDWLLDQNLS